MVNIEGKLLTPEGMETILSEIKAIMDEYHVDIAIGGVTLTESTTLDDIGVTDAIQTAIEDALNQIPDPESPFRFVTSLPDKDVAEVGVMYIVPDEPSSGDVTEGAHVDKCTEYVFNPDTKEFEQIGKLQVAVDLTPYAKKTEVQAAKEEIEEELENYAKKTDLNAYAKSEALADYARTSDFENYTEQEIKNAVVAAFTD